MKRFEKILLYDDYCPLCTWYSGLFVKFGLLKTANRVAFSKADLSMLAAIDTEKGINEIPLYDLISGQTVYGIDALLDILDQKIPFIKKAGNLPPLKWLLKKFYRLISYNRKVIVARKCGASSFDCSPAFSFFYRICFLIIFLVFNSLMLFPLHEKLFSGLSFYHLTAMSLQKGHFIFVAVNCVLARFAGRRMAIEYLGQLNVLALVSILFLTLLLFINSVLALPEWLILAYLGSLTLFIIKEYFRRMKYAGIFTLHKTFIVINIISLLVFLGYVFY